MIDKRNNQLTFKNCVSFTSHISQVNKTQVNKAGDVDIVVPMYNLIKYSENYVKTLGRFCSISRVFIETQQEILNHLFSK